MSLASQVAALATRVAGEIKALRNSLAPVATSGSATDLTGTVADAQLPSRLRSMGSNVIPTDLNTARATGFYYASNTAANRPADTYGFLDVANMDDGTVRQRWQQYNGPAKYERIYTSSAWGAWYQTLDTLTDLDARYPRRDWTVGAALRTPAMLTGGGLISVSSGAGISWSQRFIVIANGNGAHFSTNGYFDIIMPLNGTVIPGVGGAPNQTVASGAIPLPAWQALYYILPIGSGSSSVAGNFRIVNYTAASVIPDHWVMVATYNPEAGYVRFGNGMQAPLGTSMSTTDPYPQYRNAGSLNAGVIPDAQLPPRLGPTHSQDVPGSDWNNALSSGWYASSGSANAPGGNTTLWWIGVVTAHNVDWVTQEVWQFTAGDSFGPDGYRWRRFKQGGTWGAWKQIMDGLSLLDLRYAQRTYGGMEYIAAIGTSGTQTCNLASGSYFYLGGYMSGNITPSFANVPGGALVTVQIEYPMSSTAYTINLPTGGRWMGSAPTPTANRLTLVTYQTRDGGASWNCSAAVSAS